jgi:hypothetical protein
MLRQRRSGKMYTTYRENAFSSSGVAEPAMNGWKVIGYLEDIL